MELKALLQRHELHPRKRLGQNFLSDRRVVQKTLTTAEVGAEDVVLEIGSGLGILTQALAEQAQRVVALEVDEHLVLILRERLAPFPNVEIVQGDILSLDPAELAKAGYSAGYKVVANIPYYITSAVLRHLLEASARPQLIVLMVQKEVAQRIVAQPGEMSLLAVSVQFYAQPRLAFRVPASAFYPVPKVDSAVIRIDPRPQLPLPPEEIGSFFGVVRAGFAQRRKQLRNALANGLSLPTAQVCQSMESAGIEAGRRALTLCVDEWVTLYRALAVTGWQGADPQRCT